MRDALRALADLVGRVEVGEVEVNDASLERAAGGGFDVDLSVHIPGGDADLRTRGSSEQPSRTPAPASPTAEPGGDDGPADGTPGAGFGATSVRVGTALGDELAAGGTDPTTRRDGGTPAVPASSSSRDEGYVCRVDGCEETFETEHGMKIHATKAHREADGSGPSPHRDPDRLREVYARHDTFQEMTEALGVDVTAQTVRRSMMSLGIHDPSEAADDGGRRPEEDAAPGPDGGDGPPTDGGDERPSSDQDGSPPADTTDTPSEDDEASANSGTASNDADPEEPGAARPDSASVAAALPDDVDLDVLVTAVREADTVFQVQRAMGMERDEVRTLLAEVGLLDLVTGRVADEAAREVTRAEVERRIVEQSDRDEDAPGAAIEAE